MKSLLILSTLFLLISCESTLIVNDGDGSGTYNWNDVVTIRADKAPAGQKFFKWNNKSGQISEPYSDTTTVKLTRKEVTVWPEYIPLNEVSKVTITRGKGSGEYSPGTLITIEAGEPPTPEHVFYNWKGDITYLTDQKVNKQEIRVLRDDIDLEANFEILYDLTIKNGTGSGSYPQGDKIFISSNLPKKGEQFAKWIGDISLLEDATKRTHTITMPAANSTLEATYEAIPTFKVTVSDGSGDGDYLPGVTVLITADKKPSSTRLTFKEWEGDIDFLKDYKSESTSFTMVERDVNLSATYQYNDPQKTITYGMSWNSHHNRSFTWFDRTGADLGGPIKLVFSDGCGELNVPDATDNLNMNTADARYFCGTKNKPSESNGTKASAFSRVGCHASSVTVYYSK